MKLLYHIVLSLFLPFFLLRTYIHQRRYPHNRGRLKERLGVVRGAFHKPVWIHAVSYGEAVLAEQLADALKVTYPDQAILVTTMTPTGAERIQKAGIAHCYLPYDLPWFIRKFIKKVKPRCLVILETELWPTLLEQCACENIPVLLANARLSERSARGYAYVRPVVKRMLSQINQVWVQTTSDQARFIELGLPPEKVKVAGSMKFDLQVPKSQIEAGKALRKRLGPERLVWIAASTHEGEEAIVLSAFKKLKTFDAKALLLLVPRHPERFDKVAKLCQNTPFRVLRRSQMKEEVKEIDIFLGDTLGELLTFYAASDVAFVGGSLVQVGGHNVLEPIMVEVPVILGMHFFNAVSIVKRLEKAKAITLVADEAALLAAVKRLSTGDARASQIAAARQVLRQNQGALEKHVAAIKEVLF